ncbi:MULTISPECIES: hypothetical protein [unclassified Thioalkalivibrio]|uniref:capsid assembly protein n=1 Tax=unclassified Thioalkalivibrio TaxID=2621013 RepID=UPI0003743DB9|nr:MULTISPECIES: hypothetical protein [unclassified Thioalkalivibrio]
METINAGAGTPENTPAPQGHDENMVAKFDQAQEAAANVGNDAPKPAEGEKILGKFDSQEALIEAYKELEKKLGQGQQQDAPKAEGLEGVDPKDVSTDQASEAVQRAGLDMEALSDHYNQNGSIAEEHYAALEQAGIPRAYVDQYIAGVEATVSQMKEEVFSEVGGEEHFAAISEWAAANLSEAELEEYNRSVESSDLATIRSAVMGLAYRYTRENGQNPNLLGGGNATGGDSFQSVAQLTAAMSDPRYSKDPAFRAEVEAKLARSNIM